MQRLNVEFVDYHHGEETGSERCEVGGNALKPQTRAPDRNRVVKAGGS